MRVLTPDDALGEAGNGAIYELAQHGFVAAIGLTKQQASSLAVMSRQPHIAEYCPGDAERFSSIGSASRWQANRRGFVGIYAVAGSENWPILPERLHSVTEEDVRLVAYGWSGPKQNEVVPGIEVTTAYRVSEEGRDLARRPHGLKLGLPLGKLVVATAVHCFEASDPNKIGLETWHSNSAAGRLYGKLGFTVREMRGGKRLTLHRPEELRARGEVYFCEPDNDGVQRRFVPDARVYMQYASGE
jgi:ribosomal protein S18 acetylase RimI-like enzyme